MNRARVVIYIFSNLWAKINFIEETIYKRDLRLKFEKLKMARNFKFDNVVLNLNEVISERIKDNDG
jgi:hypothetical protein